VTENAGPKMQDHLDRARFNVPPYTLYRSYRGRAFTGQMTQPTVSKHWRKRGPKD